MDRREALARLQQRLAKATITTAAGGQLSPEQSKAFMRVVKEKSTFGDAISLIRRRSPTGDITKITAGARLLRGKPENADDGYRAGIDTPEVSYTAKKVWLPWEVTEDFLHENIEEQAAEAEIVDEMTQQLALDWDDLDVNGDEDSGDPFLGINDGLLKILADNASGDVHRINGASINGGAFSKAHIFAMKYRMPNQYLNQGQLRFLMSPNRATQWVEQLTDRATAAGDAALLSQGPTATKPLNIEFFEVPAFPDDRVVLTAPKNIARVVTWDVRRRKVTGDTDWELATRDKRGYLFFFKSDLIVLQDDAVVDLYGLDPIAVGS